MKNRFELPRGGLDGAGFNFSMSEVTNTLLGQ